jgi:HAE1 family hydrophobic/amphiphilic exporter-1
MSKCEPWGTHNSWGRLQNQQVTVLGVLPLAFAIGAGAMGRRCVGTTIVGGMLLSTVLNLFFIPVLYVILSRLLKRNVEPDSEGGESTPVEA